MNNTKEALRRIKEYGKNTIFSLDGLLLEKVPSSLWELTHLKTLDLSENSLKSIPPEIANLSNLGQLILSDNNLEYVPDEIGELGNLKELDLGNNRLVNVNAIFDINRLVELRLNNNAITNVEGISQLADLIRLDISHNKLMSLPSDIWKLNKLRELLVSYNSIKELPSLMGGGISLETLEIQGNLLSVKDSFPLLSALFVLKKLKKVVLFDGDMEGYGLDGFMDLSKLLNIVYEVN